MPTNKETLDLILKNTQDLAKSQLDFAAKVSIEFNKQDKINSRLIGYLETNTHTNQKGAIQELSDTVKRVDVLEDIYKVTSGKIGVLATLFVFIGGAFWSLFTYFNR